MTRSLETVSESPAISEHSIVNISTLRQAQSQITEAVHNLTDTFGRYLKSEEKTSLETALNAAVNGDIHTLNHMAPYARYGMTRATQAAFRKALEHAGFRATLDGEESGDEYTLGTLFGNITIIPPGSNEGLSLTFHGTAGRQNLPIYKVEAVNMSPVGQITSTSCDREQIAKQIQAICHHLRVPR